MKIVKTHVKVHPVQTILMHDVNRDDVDSAGQSFTGEIAGRFRTVEALFVPTEKFDTIALETRVV